MTAQEIINQWNSMSGEAQFTFCENCVKRAIKQGRKLKAGYEFDDAVQSTVEGVLRVLANPAKLDADTERRESQGKAGNTLAAVVCRAANSTMGRIRLPQRQGQHGHKPDNHQRERRRDRHTGHHRRR